MMPAHLHALAMEMIAAHSENALQVALRQSVALLDAGQLMQAAEMIGVAALISENQCLDGTALARA